MYPTCKHWKIVQRRHDFWLLVRHLKIRQFWVCIWRQQQKQPMPRNVMFSWTQRPGCSQFLSNCRSWVWSSQTWGWKEMGRLPDWVGALGVFVLLSRQVSQTCAQASLWSALSVFLAAVSGPLSFCFTHHLHFREWALFLWIKSSTCLQVTVPLSFRRLREHPLFLEASQHVSFQVDLSTPTSLSLHRASLHKEDLILTSVSFLWVGLCYSWLIYTNLAQG